jgi:pimeloyl-ACP methyl ester carboxylesterase
MWRVDGIVACPEGSSPLMDRVEIEGLNIAYERAGSGPALVLLHGYLGDGPSLWRHQLEGLARDFTVVAWDAPGAGGSSDPAEDLGIDGYARCLAGFIEALGLRSVHLVGLSFGGGLALAFQRRHRGVTRRLVLASAYAGWRGSLDRDAADARLSQAIRLSAVPPPELVEALLPTMFALPVDPVDLEAFRQAMLAVHPAGFRALAHAAAEDLSDVPPTVEVPTLLVYGDRDERAPLPVAERLHAAISGSRLVLLPGAGHICNVELPERFNEEVRSFLLGPSGEPR